MGPPHSLELGCPLGRLSGLRGPFRLGNLRRWGSSGQTLRIEATGGLGLGWEKGTSQPAYGASEKEMRVQVSALATPHLYILMPCQEAQGMFSAGGAGKLRHRAAFRLWRLALPVQPPVSSLKTTTLLTSAQLQTLLFQGPLPPWGHVLSRK